MSAKTRPAPYDTGSLPFEFGKFVFAFLNFDRHSDNSRGGSSVVPVPMKVRFRMAVKVRCPGCEKVLTVPDTARGKVVKCPSCQERISVPAAKETPAAKPAKTKKAADSEEGLLAFDLSKAEDADARVCFKCGYDMSFLDEETTECPKCGMDMATGGLGEKARKRAMKGPDPDKFYAGIWGEQWKFVMRHQILAWRTVAYVLIASIFMFSMAFCYLYVPLWPPRIFFALMTTVSAMMIPGWLWFLDQEIIKGTLERKDKLKRINMDFFLCSALGVKWVLWHLCVALPIMAIPLLIVWLLKLPPLVGGIVAAITYLPALPMMSIAMGHMVMPHQENGFMIWKLAPAWFKTFAPTFLWTALLFAVHIPVLACVGTAAALYGPSLNVMATQMDENAAIYRAKRQTDIGDKKEREKAAQNPLVTREYHKVDYSPIIVPSLLWTLGCLLLGYPAVYIMRVNGQLIYFFRERFDLQMLERQYQYKATLPRPGEEEEEKPKAMKIVVLEAVVGLVVFVIIGLVGGYVLATLNNTPIGEGLLNGLDWAMRVAIFSGLSMIAKEAWEFDTVWGLLCSSPSTLVILSVIMFVIAAFTGNLIFAFIGLGLLGLAFLGVIATIVFTIKNWQEARGGCLLALMGFFGWWLIVAIAIAVIGHSILNDMKIPEEGAAPPAGQQAPPVGMDPAQMNPGMPAPGAQPIEQELTPAAPIP